MNIMSSVLKICFNSVRKAKKRAARMAARANERRISVCEIAPKYTIPVSVYVDVSNKIITDV